MPPSSNLAQISLGLDNSQLVSGLRTAGGYLQSFATGVGARMSSLAFSPKAAKGQNWATHAAGQVAGTLAMRGIDMLVDQGKAVFDFENKLVRFGIAAKQTPMQLNAIRNAARATAVETGVDASVVLDSARAYVDLAGAQNNSIQKMNLLARAGQASEASGADLAGMMYQLTRSMKVADDQMEDTMGGLINQAKDGAIEAKQMASEFAGVLPLFARFGVIGREGAVQAGAMFQVIRDGANSAGEAGTMMQRIYAGIQSYAPRFEAHGVQIYEKQRDKLGRKVLLPWSMIFKGIEKSPDLMKDPAMLKKAFGRTEGWRGFLMLDEASRLTDADIKAGKLTTRLEDLEAAGRVNGVIQKDLATVVESTAGRMDVAFQKMKNTIAEAFTPERIEKFVGAIEGLAAKVEPLVSLVGKLADGVGAIYGAGKSIRKFMAPDSKMASTTMEDVARYQKDHPGTSSAEAIKSMQADWGRMIALKRDVEKLMPDDKTTPQSDKRVIKAALTAAQGTDELNAAMSYIYESGMTPQHQAEIERQIRKEMVDEDIAKGVGKSKIEPGVPTLDQLKLLIDQHLAPAISRAVVDANNIKPSVLHLDGNKVSHSTSNATDHRRR